MVKVYQSRFGRGDGNCFAACVASILEIPLGSVSDIPESDGWWIHFTRWARDAHGLRPLAYDYAPEIEVWLPNYEKHYIVGGKSPRFPGCFHAAVGFRGHLVHDPHPSGDYFIDREVSDYIFLPTIEEAAAPMWRAD